MEYLHDPCYPSNPWYRFDSPSELATSRSSLSGFACSAYSAVSAFVWLRLWRAKFFGFKNIRVHPVLSVVKNSFRVVGCSFRGLILFACSPISRLESLLKVSHLSASLPAASRQRGTFWYQTLPLISPPPEVSCPEKEKHEIGRYEK
jgi:hypothetical protein